MEGSGSRGNGRECSRRVFEHLSNTSEAYLGLCALGTQGATDVGSYSLRLAASQRSLTSGPEPSFVTEFQQSQASCSLGCVTNGTPTGESLERWLAGARREAETELLPLPLELARPFLSSLGKGLISPEDKRVSEGALGILAALNFLYGVGWSDTPIFPAAKINLGPEHFKVLRHLWCCAYSFFGRGVVPFSLTDSIASLKEKSCDYSGGVSVRRRLEETKVIPAWPKIGHACVVPIINLVDSELQAELASPASILLPDSEWPEVTPTSSVHADDDEWYDICVAGGERNMFVPITEEKVFRNNFGEKVTVGAMGVEKVKEIDGCKVNLLRFICILCPINAYMRESMGDSWSLPQWCLLATLILAAGEFVWVDGEDLESCFNLFTLPDSWLPYFVFSKMVASSAFGGTP